MKNFVLTFKKKPEEGKKRTRFIDRVIKAQNIQEAEQLSKFLQVPKGFEFVKACKYTRKTVDEYILLADYGQGWEEETTEQSLFEICERKSEYESNAPQYQYAIVNRRVKI